MKKAIVTGANGFIGHYLVKELVDNGYNVIAVVRDVGSNAEKISDLHNVNIIYCDMREIENLKLYITEDLSDSLFFHLAWEGSSGEKRGNYGLQLENVRYTIKAAEIAAYLGCKRFIVSGSVTQLMYRDFLRQDEVKPEIITCYAIGKMTAEAMCKCVCAELKMEFSWAYIANFYGADDTTQNFVNFLVKSYLSEIEPTLTAGTQLADFIYVTDVANALRLLGERGKADSSYYIGYGEPVMLKQYILQIYEMIAPSCGNGIGKKIFQGMSIDFDSIDYKKFYRDTGFCPAVKFEEGIKAVIKAQKKELKVK